jgi:hypothetical protein
MEGEYSHQPSAVSYSERPPKLKKIVIPNRFSGEESAVLLLEMEFACQGEKQIPPDQSRSE